MRLKNLSGDIFGGLTAGIVALPLALAFGVQSGMGAAAGLYGAIFCGFFASILGGTNTQVTGPTGPMTVISAVVIATMLEKYGSLSAAMPAILLTFFLAGAFQLLIASFRIGEWIRYIPYPVVSGFMTGIGIIIILMQVFPFLGHDSPKKIFDIFLIIHEPLSNINFYTVSLTMSTVASIYLLPLITNTIPSHLLALLILTLINYKFDFPAPVIGNIPHGIPKFSLPAFTHLSPDMLTYVLQPALTLAALGAIDSLLTAVVADNMTQTKHKSNKELFGQGIGNMITACFGGLPGAGATMRTVINIKAGGKTKLSGCIHSVFLLFILLGLGVYAAYIPLAVLAGILITVGVDIIDYRGLRAITYVPKADAIILIMVILLTVFVNLIQAVAAGMVLAAFCFMRKSSELVEKQSTVAPLENYKEELGETIYSQIPQPLKEEIYVEHLSGPLFFGIVTHFKDLLASIPSVHHVIIRLKEVPYIDQSGLHALEDAVLYLREMNIEVYFTCLQKQPEQMLKRIQLIPNLVNTDKIFPEFMDVVKYLSKKHQKKL